jgi:hypothetical protein
VRGLNPVTLHTLRHTHASQLITSGIDILTVTRRLGHSSPAIRLTVYGLAEPRRSSGRYNASNVCRGRHRAVVQGANESTVFALANGSKAVADDDFVHTPFDHMYL